MNTENTDETLAQVAQDAALRAIGSLKESGYLEPRWLNTRQAASYIGISHHHLSKLRERRHGPPYRKFGRTVIYDRLDLDAFMAERRRVDR